MPRILLTGAGGFIGRACIVPLRARGFEIFTISRHQQAWPRGVGGLPGDLLDSAALPALLRQIAPTHLLHAAWNVGPGYWTSPENQRWREATATLLRAFLDAGGQRAVGVGSCAEYAWTTDRYCEDDPTLRPPATPYGQAKLAACDDFAAASARNTIAGAASTAWARLFFPYGPGEAPGRLLPSVITALLRGQGVDVSAGTQIRDFIHVDDIGAALAALAASDLTGPINIGSGQPIALRELIAEVIRQLGGAHLIHFGALPIRPGDPPCLVADTTRMTRALGFSPRVTPEAGVASCIADWRARLKR